MRDDPQPEVNGWVIEHVLWALRSLHFAGYLVQAIHPASPYLPMVSRTIV